MERETCNRSLRFKKAERLRHRSLVEGLFREGESLYEWPLRLAWHISEAEELDKAFRAGRPQGIAPVQMLVTIPKKRIRKAVKRVLLRRRVREAYRLNRLDFKKRICALPNLGSLQLAFIYIADKETDYALIEKKMIKLLGKLADRLAPEEAANGAQTENPGQP